jgi:phage gp36-like protein
LGRSTVKSMTTRKSKEEVKKITEDKKKETISKKHLYMALGDMVQVLIGYLEIDNFKVKK